MNQLSETEELKARIQQQDEVIKALQGELEEVAALVLTTGYTVDEKGVRMMDANEYVWLDAAASILKKYHVRKK